MKKRVKRQKDNFYEEIDDQDEFVPDIAIYKFGYLNRSAWTQNVFKIIYFYARIVWLPIFKNKNVDKKEPNSYVKNGNLFVSSGFVDGRNGKQGVKKKRKCVLM